MIKSSPYIINVIMQCFPWKISLTLCHPPHSKPLRRLTPNNFYSLDTWGPCPGRVPVCQPKTSRAIKQRRVTHDMTSDCPCRCPWAWLCSWLSASSGQWVLASTSFLLGWQSMLPAAPLTCLVCNSHIHISLPAAMFCLLFSNCVLHI